MADVIGGVTSTAGTAPSNSLGQQDFLKILVTQLTYQDPLKPMDNQQFIAQMAQFTTLEQIQQLNNKIDNLVAIQSAVSSVGLIGKTVEVNAPSGKIVGVVSTLSFSAGQMTFSVKAADGSIVNNLSMSSISIIR